MKRGVRILVAALFIFALSAFTVGNNKVTICHNGHEITISINALAAHMAHGDNEGGCESNESVDEGEYQESEIIILNDGNDYSEVITYDDEEEE